MLKRCLELSCENETRLFGEVFDDERFPDGHWILTSPVVSQTPCLYVTETPTVYEVEQIIDARDFCKMLMEEKFPTEGLKYCIKILEIVMSYSEKNPVYEQQMAEFSEMAKYDLREW